MGKFSDYLISFLLVLAGMLLLIGEWLCVEIAWKCLDYRAGIVSIGFTLIAVGLILFLSVIDYYGDKNKDA